MTTKLENDSIFHFYTYYTKNVINGRKADKKNNIYPIYGLYAFMKKVMTICDDAKAEYPYAVWWLYRISMKQIETEEIIYDRTSELRELIGDDIVISDEDLKLQKHDLIKKDKFHTSSKNLYIQEQLRLVISFDYFCLLLFKTLELELISKDEFYKQIRLANKTILSANNEAMGYSGVPATLKSVKFNEKEYRDAVKLMGELPSDLLQIIDDWEPYPTEDKKRSIH